MRVLSDWTVTFSAHPEDFVMSLKPLRIKSIKRASRLTLLGLCRSWKYFELLAMVDGKMQPGVLKCIYVYGSYLYGFEWDHFQERVLLPAPNRTYSVKILFN